MSKQVVKVEGSFEWKCWRDPATDVWVGVCDPLRLTTEAESFSKLLEEMNTSVQILFRDLIREGELDAFFREVGWTPTIRMPIPVGVPVEDLDFDVPFGVAQVRRPEAYAA